MWRAGTTRGAGAAGAGAGPRGKEASPVRSDLLLVGLATRAVARDLGWVLESLSPKQRAAALQARDLAQIVGRNIAGDGHLGTVLHADERIVPADEPSVPARRSELP